MAEEELVIREDPAEEQLDAELERLKAEKKEKRKRRLLEEAAKAAKRGVCYLSRIPPRMDPLKLRQILSQYGELERIYLTPEDPAAHIHRKKAGGFRGQGFTEGWVEFTNKNVAKRVASMLNGEQIGGRKKSSFYYDLWNIKYLSKFKWDHLTEEIAYKNATREQKLALELSTAKKERDFYLAKVDQSRALSSIDERLKKKRKTQEVNGSTADIPGDHQAAKVMRMFRQTKPVRDGGEKQKQGLSKDLLAGVFGGSP
uniref:pre-rRNA-processing protein esf2 n=1 Tax=Erigeron canadensis TaxID=72917 RepID=UPI001CB968CE|nr:pre-rRNA-processing protein esf2 [Erigeron canadensis]